jgi:hypothetical protein
MAEATTKPEVTILDATGAAQADAAPLPPAGDARRDEMKQRYDVLMAQAAAFEADFGAIDPRKLRPENDIARFSDAATEPGAYVGRPIDGSEVDGALPGYTYTWEQADINNRYGALWVTGRKALGWEVVTGSMPEEQRRRIVDGTRRWGDTILLRIPTARYEVLEADDRRRRLARGEGIALNVLEEAERKGVKVHDLASDRTPAHIRAFAHAQAAAAEAARSTMVSTMRQAGRSGATRVLASEIANRRLSKAIRDGSVPGMPVGA